MRQPTDVLRGLSKKRSLSGYEITMGRRSDRTQINKYDGLGRSGAKKLEGFGVQKIADEKTNLTIHLHLWARNKLVAANSAS